MATGNADYDPPRILVVEDDPPAQRMYAGRLRAKGFHVITADNAREAVRKARDARPAVIVLDLMLPDRSGYDVARELRLLEETHAIPIIMVSASVKLRGGEAAAVGADCVLYKPVSLATLHQKIERLLAGRSDPPTVRQMAVGGV